MHRSMNESVHRAQSSLGSDDEFALRSFLAIVDSTRDLILGRCRRLDSLEATPTTVLGVQYTVPVAGYTQEREQRSPDLLDYSMPIYNHGMKQTCSAVEQKVL